MRKTFFSLGLAAFLPQCAPEPQPAPENLTPLPEAGIFSIKPELVEYRSQTQPGVVCYVFNQWVGGGIDCLDRGAPPHAAPARRDRVVISSLTETTTHARHPEVIEIRPAGRPGTTCYALNHFEGAAVSCVSRPAR